MKPKLCQTVYSIEKIFNKLSKVVKKKHNIWAKYMQFKIFQICICCLIIISWSIHTHDISNSWLKAVV